MGPRMAAQREGCADETEIEPYRPPFALLAISTIISTETIWVESIPTCCFQIINRLHKYQIYDVMQIP